MVTKLLKYYVRLKILVICKLVIVNWTSERKKETVNNSLQFLDLHMTDDASFNWASNLKYPQLMVAE